MGSGVQGNRRSGGTGQGVVTDALAAQAATCHGVRVAARGLGWLQR